MKRAIALTVAGIAVSAGLGGSAVAKPAEPKPNNVAAKQCQAEKQADRAAFDAAYGPKQAMRNCKRKHRGEATAAVANASQECRAEQEADPALFDETYGSNGNGANAFGKCVSGKVKAETSESAEEFANAAKECREQRAADPDAFAEEYGTNRNNRNAFGKCVSKNVHDQEAEETPAS